MGQGRDKAALYGCLCFCLFMPINLSPFHVYFIQLSFENGRKRACPPFVCRHTVCLHFNLFHRCCVSWLDLNRNASTQAFSLFIWDTRSNILHFRDFALACNQLSPQNPEKKRLNLLYKCMFLTYGSF